MVIAFKNRLSLCVLTIVLSVTNVLAKPIVPQQIKGTTYTSELGAIATVNPIATRFAAGQLESGGNAVDAAIAAALALGVVDGYNSGIGGGLFAVVHWADGRVEAIDAREMAAARAHKDMYIGIDEAGKPSVIKHLSRVGALSIGVPGSVAAFDYLSEKGGVKDIADLYKGSAQIAEDGFKITNDYHSRIKRVQKHLKKFPASAKIFFDEQGNAHPAGAILKQNDLANTYRKLAKQGADYFYKGVFAKLTESWMREHRGVVEASDFANYTLKIREPVRSEFLGHDVIGFPPASSGGIHVAQILNILKQVDIKSLSTEDYQHRLVESMKLAYADRAHWLGDSDFAKVPKGLISEQYAQKLSKEIDHKQASTVSTYGTPEGAGEELFGKHTTHIATADKFGNWVSITTTVNTTFGSKVVIPGTGVIMNNQMDDFSARPGVPNAFGLVGSEANSIQPGKRPLSSMSPTIVLKDGKPILAIGAAGGPRIITQVTQAIVNYLAFDDDLYTSLAKPRLHQQWKPDMVFFDKKLSVAHREALTAKGHQLKQLRFEGSTNAVSLEGEHFKAVSEPRLLEREIKK